MTTRPCPLVIDTDPGVDDAFALALAATSPEVELIAVTTVHGNVSLEQTTSNALRVLALCGRDDVPVAAGAAQPLVHGQVKNAAHAHGADGLGDMADSLPTPGRTASQVTAVDLLAGVLATATRPVTVVGIGPLTNIAQLITAYPDLVDRIGHIVVMGGGMSRGNITSAAEFNVWKDPEAAHRVLAAPRAQTTLVPLDLTHQVSVPPAWLDTLSWSGPVGAKLVTLAGQYRSHYRRQLGQDVLLLHDVVAVAEAIWPGTLTTNNMTITVDCDQGPTRGATTASSPQPPVRPVSVATGGNIEDLRARILTRLSDRG